jgi:hypothetical protein
MKKIIMLFMLLALCLSISSCGGGGAGSADAPQGENRGVPSVVKLSPSQFVAQTNSFISLHAKVLDGNGSPVSGVRVTFTNLSDPFGKITSAVLRFLGIHKAATMNTTTAKTNSQGIATVKLSSTSSGFATVQAEVNRGSGTVRDKKTVFFSTYSLIFPGIPVPSPTLFLDVDTNASFSTPNEPSDFVLFKTAGDNQRSIRVTVYDSNGAVVPGSIVTLGSDSADLTYENGANEIIKITDANGQVTATATVNPSALSQATGTINVTASADNGASNLLTLFLEPVVIDGSASSLSASPMMVVVNGTSAITANVKINTGGPAPDNTSVNFTTTCGAVDPFAETTDGVAKATFTAPATVPSGGICTVSGKVAGVAIGSADITIVEALAVQPGSQSVNGVTGNPSVSYTISGGISPYVVTSNDASLPASLIGSTFTINVPAGTPAKTVTYTVTDFVGNSVAASLVITGPTSLQILPPSVTVVSKASFQTVSFVVSGSPNTPYIMTSSDPTKAFNDDGAGAHSGNGIFDADEGGIWTSLISPAVFTVTIPANVTDGTVTLNVFDSVGGTTSATITIISGGAGGGAGTVAVAPSAVSVTGASDMSDNVTFLITGGTPGTCPSPTYSVFSDNTAVVPNPPAVTCSAPFQFTIDPNAVAASTSVGLTVVDSVGAIAKASVTVTPATASLGINPSTISVFQGAPITFTIIGGVSPFRVYTSDTGVITLPLGNNPYVIPTDGGNPFDGTTVGKGTAIITVVDSDNKTVTSNVTVNAPPTVTPIVLSVTPLTATICENDVTCSAHTDVAVFTVSGGTPPYFASQIAPAGPPNATINFATSTIFTVDWPNNTIAADTPVTIAVTDSAAGSQLVTVTVIDQP